MVALASMSLLISAGFWQAGATMVAPFACVETLALALAYVMYARRALDREDILFSDQTCEIRQCRAGRVQKVEWPLAWVRVTCNEHTGHLIEIESGVRGVRVGHMVPAWRRLEVARAMTQALRQRNFVSN